MPNSLSDEELLMDFVAGKHDAFEPLVRRYEHRLYAFICRMNGDATGAADLFQETFMRVFRHAHKFGRRGSFKSWLYSIAANVCRTHRGRRRPEQQAIDSLDSEPVNGSAQPANASSAKEAGERIAEAVADLPADQRDVFVLRMYEDLSYPEIAETLERSLGTVKSQMRYALQKLRTTLRDLAEAYGIDS